MKLYIMRHSETDWNKEKRLQGHTDIPLNKSGRQLARATAAGMADIVFQAAYTSPLARARETAELILNGRNIPLIVDERLKEMSFGPYEGLCCARDNYEIPDEHFINFFTAPELYQPPAGADSFANIKERVGSLLSEITQMGSPDDNILLVGHGVVVGVFLSIAENRPLADFWKDKVQKNCAVNILEIKGDKHHVLEKGIIYYEEALPSI